MSAPGLDDPGAAPDGPTVRALRAFAAKAPLMMAGSVAAGLLLPELTAVLRPWVSQMAVVLIVAAMMRVEPARLRLAFARPLHVLAVCAVILGLIPALTLGGALAMGAPAWLATGLTLAAAAPPLSSAGAFAVLVRTDPALVTAISIPATLLAPATIWALASALPGVAQGLDLGAISLRLAGLIAMAFGASLTVRRLAGPARVRRAAPGLDALAAALMALIGFAVTHDIGAALRADALAWFGLAAATAAVALAGCLLTWAIFRRQGPERAAAAALAACVRNMAVMVAAILGVVEERIALVVITAQIPIYAAPLVLRPLFARLGRLARPEAAS